MILTQLGTLIKSAWQNVTVEFYMLLFFLGYALHSAAAFPLFYDKVCRSMYDESICSTLSSHPHLEVKVQMASSEWSAYIELGRFVPTVIGTMFLSSYGDHYSTKRPVLVSVALMIAYMATYTALLSFPHCPLYSIIICSSVLAIGGQFASFITCLYSFLAKKVDDENRLTFRYAVLTAFWSGAYVISGNIAPFLYHVMSYQYVMVIAQAIVILNFVLALLFYPRDPELVLPEKQSPTPQCPQIQCTDPAPREQTHGTGTPISSPSVDSDHGTNPNSAQRSVLAAMCMENAILYKSAWKTITKSRPNYGRAFLILFSVIGIVYGSEDGGFESVYSLFAYKTPLSWTPSLLGVWGAAMSLVQMTGSLVSAYVFQRLRVPNIWILVVGMGSACLKMVMTSISTETWMMFAALALGCISTVGFSGLRACVAQLGSTEETGELQGCLSASGSIVPVFSVLVYNSVYTATLSTFSGATFAVCASFLAVCMLALIFMSVYLRRERQ